MKGREKVGRNDPCPCGSGEKFKRCCQQKLGAAGSGGALTLVVLIGVLTVVIVAGISWFTRDSVPTGSRRVWSPEHGHYHTVP